MIPVIIQEQHLTVIATHATPLVTFAEQQEALRIHIATHVTHHVMFVAHLEERFLMSTIMHATPLVIFAVQ